MEISWTSSDLNPIKLELVKTQTSWKLRNTFLDNSYQRGKQNYLESKGEQSMGCTTTHTLSRKLKASDTIVTEENLKIKDYLIL